MSYKQLSFRLIQLILVGVAVSSCVTNKKYVYLQKDDVNTKGMPLDTVLRSYDQVGFEYQIQYEDIISVRFESLSPEEYDFLNRRQQQMNFGGINQGGAMLIGEIVDKNGEIPFPFIGKVKVSDLTIFEIQDKLQTIASQYLQSPVVKVRLLNYRFTILGEVNSEGMVTVSNNRISLMEAIGLAGGLTDLADKAQVKLIRSKNGVSEVSYINLLEEEFLTSPMYYLNQGDILIVPALRQRPYRRYFGQNISLVVSTLSLILLTINLLNN